MFAPIVVCKIPITLIDLAVVQQPLDALYEAGSNLAIIHGEAPNSLLSCRTLLPCDRNSRIFSISARPNLRRAGLPMCFPTRRFSMGAGEFGLQVRLPQKYSPCASFQQALSALHYAPSWCCVPPQRSENCARRTVSVFPILDFQAFISSLRVEGSREVMRHDCKSSRSAQRV